MKKQPEITEQTKQNLVNAFCGLYSQKPIEKITINQITSLAHYHRSTFYQYFVDIYDVLEYIEDNLLNCINEELGKDTFNPQIPNVQNLLLLFEQKEKYLNALLGNYGNFHFWHRLKEEIIAKNKIVFPSQYNSIAPYLMEFHMAISTSLFQLWLTRGKDLSIDELSALVHKLYTTGISGIITLKI